MGRFLYRLAKVVLMLATFGTFLAIWYFLCIQYGWFWGLALLWLPAALFTWLAWLVLLVMLDPLSQFLINLENSWHSK